MTDISKEKIERLANGDCTIGHQYAITLRALFARIAELEVKVNTTRNDALREAATVADEWYMNIGKGTPSGEILALIDKENKL